MSNQSLPFDFDSFSPSTFTNQQYESSPHNSLPSHYPQDQDPQDQVPQVPQDSQTSQNPPNGELKLQEKSDSEEFFSLDMLSVDMDFEQAYNRYSSLQQKSAMSAVEHLQTVQALNQQYVNMFMSDSQHSLPTQQHPMAVESDPRPGVQARQSSFPGNHSFQFGSSSSEFDYHRQAIINNDLSHQPIPNYSTSKSFAEHDASIGHQDGESSDSPASSDDSDYDLDQNATNNNEFDQFFSNTESNALEKFLDNLASNDTNPFEFYQQHPGAQSQDHLNEFNEMFDLRTMKQPQLMSKPSMNIGEKGRLQQSPRKLQQQQRHPTQQQQSQPQSQSQLKEPVQEESIHELLKREITEAFTHSPLSSLTKFPSVDVNQSQLPTPLDSRQSSSSFVEYNRKNPMARLPKQHQQHIHDTNEESTKRSFDEVNPQSPPISPSQIYINKNNEDKPQKKRRKQSSKPLLTLEQKRLNHSNSEQKRRQLCKLAYDRCLRLVTNVDDYRNEIVMASAMSSSKKKSKRKQLTKEGLPNLSKHTALLKISNEIVKIKRKNEALQKLIDESSSYAY